MAKKKKKSMGDYDPLAWLNESEPESKSDESEEDKKTVKKAAKKASPKKSAKKKSVKKAASKKSVKKAAAKKVKKKSVKTAVSSKPKVTEDTSSDEDNAFGFFKNEGEVESSPVDNESEVGFGFFVNNDEADVVAEAKVESSENEGFGFFGNEPEIKEPEGETEEDGFGFFAEDELLVKENMETLDITKDEAINLGAELTIKTVSEIKEKIDGLLSADEDVVINAEEMIKIDTSGLQLLYSLKETLNQTGHHIKWIGTSSVINDSAEMIGMPMLSPKSKAACFGFFEENMEPKDAEDGSSGFF